MKYGEAQSWIYVTSAKDSSMIYIRANPVRLQQTIKVWVKTTEGKIMNDNNGVQVIPRGNTISLVEFDCLNQKYRILTLTDLDSEGNIVDNLDLNGFRSSWFPIIPNSIYENVLMMACELIK